MRWEHELTYLMRRLAGKDLGTLCYVCDWTRPGVRRVIGAPPPDEHAFTSPKLDGLLEDYLRLDGFWHGPGYACAIDPTGLNQRQRIGTALHEAAHWVCWRHGLIDQHGQDFQAAARRLQRRCPSISLEDIGDVFEPA